MRAWQINATLMLVALIWGVGFVPQKLALDYLDPAAFNAIRFALGGLVLLPVLYFSRNVSSTDLLNRSTVFLGLVLGALLFVGAFLQQVSLQYTSVANVSFITGLYAIIVPLIGYFLGYRYGLIVWGGGVLAIVGLYLMTQTAEPEVAKTALKGDLIAMTGAIIWAVHLLVISEKASGHKQLVLAFHQFLFCAVLSFILALVFEERVFPNTAMAFVWPVLSGVIVVGLAFTLQVMMIEKAEPFSASLILSLEAVFGALAGYFWLNENMTLAAVFGAALMLFGCLLAQLSGAKAEPT